MPAESSPAPPGPSLMLSKADIASRCSLSARTLERLIAAGRFPAPDVRLSKTLLRWRPQTVADAIDRLAGE